MKQLPLHLMGDNVSPGKTIPQLRSYVVHMISLQSLHKSSDGYLLIPHQFYISDPEKDINTKSKKDTESARTTLYFYPVVSFDGYNVLLLSNITDECLDAFVADKPSSTAVEGFSYDDFFIIDAYDLDEVDLESLTEKGLDQFKSACIAAEMYELIQGI